MGYSIAVLDAICDGCGTREGLAADTFDQVSNIWYWNRMMRRFGWFLESFDPPFINRMYCPKCKEKIMIESTALPLSERIRKVEQDVEAARRAFNRLADIATERQALFEQLKQLDLEEAELQKMDATASASKDLLRSLEAVLDASRDDVSSTTVVPVSEPAAAPEQEAAAAPSKPPQEPEVAPSAPAPTQAEQVLALLAAEPWLTAGQCGERLPHLPRPAVVLSKLFTTGRASRYLNGENTYVYALPDTPLPEAPHTAEAAPSLPTQPDAPTPTPTEREIVWADLDAQPASTAADIAERTTLPEDVVLACLQDLEAAERVMRDESTPPSYIVVGGADQKADESEPPAPAPAPALPAGVLPNATLPAHLREIPSKIKPDSFLIGKLVDLARDQARAMSEGFYIGRLTKNGTYKGAEVTAAIRIAVEQGQLAVVMGDKYGLPQP